MAGLSQVRIVTTRLMQCDDTKRGDDNMARLSLWLKIRCQKEEEGWERRGRLIGYWVLSNVRSLCVCVWVRAVFNGRHGGITLNQKRCKIVSIFY